MDVIGEFPGESPGAMSIRELLSRLLQLQGESPSLPPILIQGEVGTGKGFVARLIHRSGPRAAAPFVKVNCAAIPESILEAEMFGFERREFTAGNVKEVNPGLFEAAHRGTIFLKEVGACPRPCRRSSSG